MVTRLDDPLDALLLSPPLMHDAVAPAVALPALKAYLAERGHRASIRDLNAEFLYDHVVGKPFIRKFLNTLARSDRRRESVFVFHDREWSRSCFAQKPVVECGVDEIEESVFSDERARAHYFRCVARLFDLEAADCHLDAFRERAREGNPLLEAFYRDRLPAFFEHGFPPVVGVSLTETTQLYAGFLLIAMIKARSPATRLLIGGPWCLASSPLHARILETFPDVDGVVNFEGEIPLALVVEQSKGRDVGEIPGLMYREGGVVRAPSRYETVPMDALPVPDFSEFPLHLYPGLLLPVPTYRGCSWGKCVFCIGQESASPRETRTARRVVEIMAAHVAATGCSSFFMGESSTPLDQMEAIADELLARDLRVQWSVLTRADWKYTPDLCAKLYKAGLRYMYVGLETLSREHLHLLKKGIHPDEFFHTARQCAAAGLRVIAFIMNFPMNTMDDMEVTFQAVLDYKDHLEDLIVQIFRLPLATEAFRKPEIMGIEVMPAEGENLDVFGLEYRSKNGFDNERFVDVEKEYVRRFHTARGSRAKSSPECWIDGALRRSRHRPEQPRPAVALASFLPEGARPGDDAVPHAVRCVEQYLLRDPELADRFEIRAVALDPAGTDDAARGALAAEGLPVFAALGCDAGGTDRTLAFCRTLKQASPDTVIVLFGEAGGEAAAVLRDEPSVDYVVVGEGEVPIERLLRYAALRDGTDLAAIPGLARRDGTRVVVPAGPAETPLDRMPTVYTRDTLRDLGDRACIETARGEGGLRRMPLERIDHDAWAVLSRAGARTIELSGPDLDADPARLDAVLGCLGARGRANAGFSATLSPDAVDDAIARRIAAAGPAPIRLLLLPGAPGAIQAPLARLEAHVPRDRIAFDVPVGLPGDDLAGLSERLRGCFARGLYRVRPYPVETPPGTASPFPVAERAPALRLAASCAILGTVLAPVDLAFLAASGVDLAGLCADLDLGAAAGDVSEAAIRSVPRAAVFGSLLEALRTRGVPGPVRDVAQDVFAYREAEHALVRRAPRDPAVVDGRDLDPDERVRAAPFTRVRLDHDLRPLLRGDAPTVAEVPRSPAEWFLVLRPATSRVAPILPPAPALFAALMAVLGEDAGTTFRELFFRVERDLPSADARALAGIFRRLADSGLIVRAF